MKKPRVRPYACRKDALPGVMQARAETLFPNNARPMADSRPRPLQVPADPAAYCSGPVFFLPKGLKMLTATSVASTPICHRPPRK